MPIEIHQPLVPAVQGAGGEQLGMGGLRETFRGVQKSRGEMDQNSAGLRGQVSILIGVGPKTASRTSSTAVCASSYAG